MSQLNEALILRTTDGSIRYCNEFGLKLIEPISRNVLKTDAKLDSYFKTLRSLDFFNQTRAKIQSDNNIISHVETEDQ